MKIDTESGKVTYTSDDVVNCFGKKIILKYKINKDGDEVVEEGTLKKLSPSREFVWFCCRWVQFWIEIDDITHIEELPKKKWWQCLK